MATAKRIAAAIALVLAAVAFLAGIVTGFAAPGWVLPLAVLLIAAILVV